MLGVQLGAGSSARAAAATASAAGAAPRTARSLCCLLVCAPPAPPAACRFNKSKRQLFALSGTQVGVGRARAAGAAVRACRCGSVLEQGLTAGTRLQAPACSAACPHPPQPARACLQRRLSQRAAFLCARAPRPQLCLPLSAPFFAGAHTQVRKGSKKAWVLCAPLVKRATVALEHSSAGSRVCCTQRAPHACNNSALARTGIATLHSQYHAQNHAQEGEGTGQQRTGRMKSHEGWG